MTGIKTMREFQETSHRVHLDIQPRHMIIADRKNMQIVLTGFEKS
jgi:hypothetical protein